MPDPTLVPAEMLAALRQAFATLVVAGPLVAVGLIALLWLLFGRDR